LPEILKVVLLGVVEGITEFLPISSTGHLIVASALLKFKDGLGGTFELFIQIGAVFAVLQYYWSEIFRQVRTVRHDHGTQHFWGSIIIGSIPAAFVGLLLHDWFKAHLFTPTVVAIALIIGGVIFLIVERRVASEAEPTATTLTSISWRQALGVGFAQMLALVPGVSRSGASIIGGMLGGLDRRTATEFSFYLALPVLGGATILDLLLSLNEVQSGDVVRLVVGAVVSGIVAWFSIGWLLRYVSRNSFVSFGYYRIAAGILILLLVAAGQL